jgi:tRNA modification GTPase
MGAGIGDEVVAVVIAREPPEVEVYAHGGSAAVALVTDALVAGGAELRRPVAWVRHDARSAIAAEARVDLASAPTVRTAEILLEQAQGALEADIRKALAALADDPMEALYLVDALLGRAGIGLRLIAGWRVVLAGRPNVGKSRLLNALTGYDRAIVDATPGTTRDVVTARTALDGWPVELADTAGLRPSDDPIEASGVALARARQGEADLVLVVLDRSVPLTDLDRAVIVEHSRGLFVANKCDLPAAWSPGDLDAVAISAERGDGIEELVATIASRLVPEAPPPHAGVPFRASQFRRLRASRAALMVGDHGAAARNLAAIFADLPLPFDRGD